jgi:hypothetical protein
MNKMIQEKLNELAILLVAEYYENDLKTNLVLVTDELTHAEVIGVFRNGVRQNTPMEVAMVAADSAQLVRNNAIARVELGQRAQPSSR